MAVCEGDLFTLRAPWQERVNYEWIIGNPDLAGFWKKTCGDKDTAAFQIRSQGVDAFTVMQFDIKLVRTVCHSITDTAAVTVIDTVFPAPDFRLSDSTVCSGNALVAQIINPLPNVPYWWVFGSDTIYNTPTLTLNPVSDRAYQSDIKLFYQPLPECKPRGTEKLFSIYPLPSLFLTWGDHGDRFHITTDAREGQDYRWERNGALLPGRSESGLYDNMPGQYCCRATNQYGCVNSACITVPASAQSAPLQPVMQMSTASNPPVPLPLTVTVEYTTATIRNSLGIPADSLTWTSNGMPGMAVGHTNIDTLSIWEFAHTGYCPISVSGTYNGVAYSGQTTVAVPVKAGWDLGRICTYARLVDYSTYMHDHAPQPRIFRIIGENGTLYQSVFSNSFTGLDVDLPQFSNRLDYDVIFINETCTLQTIFKYDKVPTVLLSSTGGLCVKSPIDLHYQTVSSLIFYPKWIVSGTETGAAGLIDNSTLYSETPNPAVWFRYEDANGCSYSPDLSLDLQPNKVDGNIVLPYYSACLGDLYPISYLFNEPYSGDVSYYWKPDSTITGNSYPAYETGDYSVTALDNSSSCSAHDEINVVFDNKPVALITGKTNYCRYDSVKLEGFEGSGYVYIWQIFDPQTQNYTTLPGRTLAFLPSHAGSYKIILNVFLINLSVCSSVDTLWIKVFDNNFTPVIDYGNNRCIHEPPVQLVSVNQLPLYWSNGAYGTSADFYSAGVASAYYLDPESGCKSNDALITVWPQPNYEALLTGCYAKCSEFFEYPLGVYALAPYSLNYWGWVYQDQQIANGSNSTPAALPLIGPGDYMFGTQYISGCVTESPHLIIKEAYYCSCDDKLDLSYNIKNLTCRIKNCRFEYTVEMILHNSSDMPLYLQSLSLQHAQLISCNGSSSFIPSAVPAHGYATYTITFIADNPDSENFVFRFFSSDMNCYYDVPVSLNAEYYYNPCKVEICKGYLKDYKYLYEFERELPFTYHRIILVTEPDMQIAAIRSEQGEILDYHYDSYSSIVDLLYLYDYNHLLQMANHKEEVCFYVRLCRDDKMCEVKICIPAKYLLEGIPYKPKSALMEQPAQEELPSDLQSALTLHIVPNPAETEFSVTGINPKNISELKLLSLTGSEIKTIKGSAGMNISDITPAIYIVRVIDTSGKVYYLKLVKQ
jgi:hypothetical protein